jgi:hypothetical protein
MLEVVDTTTGQATASDHGIVEGASFAPSEPDRLVFGLGQSMEFSQPQNLWTMPADGSAAPAQLTRDGHSIDPVWGSRGVVFVSYRGRGRDKAPLYRLMMRSGAATKSIATVNAGGLISGLEPVAVSSDGRRLVAQLVGEDTVQAYSVNLVNHRVHAYTVKSRQEVSGFGISRDGRQVLISYGGFEGPSTHAKIAAVPFGGGKAKVLVTGGDFPSWNR